MDPWIFVNRDTIRKFPTASHILLTNCFSTFNLYCCASNFLWRYSAGLRKWKCSAWVEILTSLRYWLHQRIFRLVIRFTIHLWLEVLSSRSSSKFQNVYIGKEDLWNQEGWEIKRIMTIGDTGKNKTKILWSSDFSSGLDQCFQSTQHVGGKKQTHVRIFSCPVQVSSPQSWQPWLDWWLLVCFLHYTLSSASTPHAGI